MPRTLRRAAQVYNLAVETPLIKAEALSEQLDNTILLKREDMQVGLVGGWL